jgi:hypothetical protein
MRAAVSVCRPVPAALPAARARGVCYAAPTQSASYKELESITCDLSAFPTVQFFRVEVGTASNAEGLGSSNSSSAAVATAGQKQKDKGQQRTVSPALCSTGSSQRAQPLDQRVQQYRPVHCT